MNKMFYTAALAGVLAAGVSALAQAEEPASVAGPTSTIGKCYGIAKAGKNACANKSGGHSCQGQATVDNAPGDFVLGNIADCEKQGGSNTPPK